MRLARRSRGRTTDTRGPEAPELYGRVQRTRYGSGHAGMARRVDDRLGRMPHSLDVVLMQVVDECPVIPLGVLRPNTGLAADGRAIRDGGREECIHGVPTVGGERNMRRCGHGLPTADREVVQVLGPVGDTVVLNVKLLVTEWGEGA